MILLVWPRNQNLLIFHDIVLMRIYLIFAVYYQQQPQFQMAQPRHPMSQPPVQPQQPYKRKKNIIQITDPNTGQVINQDSIANAGNNKTTTPPLSASGSSSSRGTPNAQVRILKKLFNFVWHMFAYICTLPCSF